MRSVPLIKLSSRIYLLFLFLFTFCSCLLSFSQNEPESFKKFSPTLKREYHVAGTQDKQSFVIALSSNLSFKEWLVKTRSIFSLYEYPATNVFIVHCTWREMMEVIASRSDVIFIDRQRIPKEEVAVSNLDLSTNKVNFVHRHYPDYNGSGLGVSIKENRPDTTDIDFKGRYQHTALASAVLSNHATIMSTIVAGAGNTYYEGRGVAIGANINSVNFSNLLPEPNIFYQQFNVTVQNHSYGTGIENFYGADASAYDASVIQLPALTHVFSAGNSGNQTSTSGNYAGIALFANITGSFKMGKNLLTVGHTDSFNTVLPLSSRGPAYDGRIKPELVAFGEDGSSGAAAIVSGIALTLQNAYKDINGTLPSSALIRAVLVNSADEVATKGIDFISGYGAVNAIKAMQAITTTKYFSGAVNNGGINSHSLIIPSNIKQVRITLTWNDPPATANASKAIVNDLDLELAFPPGSQSWQPWVLSHFPHVDSLIKLPVRKRDSLNTIEQITIENPMQGDYSINVRGFNVPASSPQNYFVTYQFDTLDKFTWLYPATTDNIFSGTVNTIRWENSFTATNGQLQYSNDNGSNWQTISNAVDLTTGYFKWNAPDTFVTALLRMNFSTQSFSSETFTIARRFEVNVGFNCPDSFLLYWNKQKGVTNYRVYGLGDRYMESLLTTNDTSIVLEKSANPTLHYAVAPLLQGLTGVRSYGFNYTSQGVGCYIRTFFASLSGTAAILDLELGTVYQVKSIDWEKMIDGKFVSLQQISAISGLPYSYADPLLKTGMNIYRAKITLMDGRFYYTDPETVYYFGAGNYIVYPNPASQYQDINILSNDAQSTRLQIFNSQGSLVYVKQMNDLNSKIPTGLLSKGLYLLHLTGNDNKIEILKLIVQ